MLADCENRLKKLVEYAWDNEVSWPQIKTWTENFVGDIRAEDEERLYALFSLTRYMYFGRRLTREMLKALYRDHFESVLMQRIRRNHGGTSDIPFLRRVFKSELAATRFIGVGNPAESGAHLLYFFRQVNRLPKDLFVDFMGAFRPQFDRKSGSIVYAPIDGSVSRYVFFDDLVGSATQTTQYLSKFLLNARSAFPRVELRFVSLFATSQGLQKLNEPQYFDGNASCLFELDATYKAFEPGSRYFSSPPPWFDLAIMKSIALHYGTRIQPKQSLGYKDGQLLLAFSHNTPDNAPPIFWDEGRGSPWSPIFLRYDKAYGGVI